MADIDIEAPGAEASALSAALRSASALLYGTTRVADTTLTTTHIDTIVPVSTGSSAISITLATGATAGSVQYIQKIDTGSGYVVVKDEAGKCIDILTAEEHIGGYAPDEDASGWHSLGPNKRFRLGTGRYFNPFGGAGSGQNAANFPVLDTIYVHPVEFDGPRVIDGLGMAVIANTLSGWKAKCALYEWDPASPNSPINAALLSGQGSEVGNGGGVTGKSSVVSTFTAVQLPKHGRAWAAYKSNQTQTGASVIMTMGGIGDVIGGSSPLQMTGFSTDPIKGFSFGTQTYANAFPANLPGSTTEVLTASVPIMFPRLG